MTHLPLGRELIAEHDVTFSGAADVIVVGTGAAGFAAAVTAAEHGASVILVEKADAIGGTTRKAAAAFWVPNNHHMRAHGQSDPKRDALLYMARLTSPATYDPDDPHLGLTPWQHSMIELFYDSAGDAVAQLEAWGALEPVPAPLPDYYMQLAEDKAPSGRLMSPRLRSAEGAVIGDGRDMIAAFAEAAQARHVDVRTGHRVVRAVVSAGGAVSGVLADTADGLVALRAERGVVFASGGFTHNAELRRNFLAGPILSGCAARTNTGDFIGIAQALGADLANMNSAWLAPMVLDRALSGDPEATCSFNIPGDSMIFVNRAGRRVVNEKAPYHDLGTAFWAWDSHQARYPNLVLAMIWDQYAKKDYSGAEYGSPMVPDDHDHSHILTGANLDQLADAIRGRAAEVADLTGGWQLDDDFTTNLRESIERFNEFARNGADHDFHRGEAPIEQIFHGTTRVGNHKNPTMWPIAEDGPYYATLLCPATLDTKGGPRTNEHGQVLHRDGTCIPGLYGAGNCVAAMSGGSYWAAGATLGPIITFAYIAGRSAAQADGRRRFLRSRRDRQDRGSRTDLPAVRERPEYINDIDRRNSNSWLPGRAGAGQNDINAVQSIRDEKGVDNECCFP